ncbi:hypothetical protein CSA80_00010 [Candidatus Saccharibacteria bacterium]|nr:MAG: hypothetical protein CR973_00925 [Candidatus Saccharibacteria bacterium]PID99666.1 MAG: hypothetical protein CSA80_00010 [Candidatus Saccharibacteria bacterium]
MQSTESAEAATAHAIDRREFFGQCGRLGLVTLSVAAAVYRTREQWYESIQRDPEIQTIYAENRSAVGGNKHLVLIAGTATTHTWDSHALVPVAGQFAQIHALKHGSEGIDVDQLTKQIHQRVQADQEHQTSPQDVVLVGTSQGANLALAIAAAINTDPSYENTRICQIVLRDPPFGEESIRTPQRYAAAGMSAASGVVSNVGPGEYFMGELAHIAPESLPLWQKVFEAGRRTLEPIGPKTLADQITMITEFPHLWPRYAQQLRDIPIHLVQSGLDTLVEGGFVRKAFTQTRPDIIVHELPHAPHGAFYFPDDAKNRRAYLDQAATMQRILFSTGWKPVWDVAAGRPYEEPGILPSFRLR